MSAPFYTIHRNLLLVTLWGLIFAKCFTLEYFVHIYSVPINSALYVWTLSISMAAAATFVFARLKAQQAHAQTSLQPKHIVWGICSLGMLLVLAAGFWFNRIPHLMLPACLAVLIGFGYGTHGLLAKNPIYTVSGLGWWIGAAVLFAQSSVTNLLIFALLIIAFSVAPTVLQMFRQPQALKHG
jgi:hypothetical protein